MRSVSENGVALLYLYVFVSSGISVAQKVSDGTLLGINYGQIGNNLPDPRDAVALVRSLGATHIKLFDANPRVLAAFARTGISFTLGVGNEFLAEMRDPAAALFWAQRNVQAHLPQTTISSVAVGNEVLTLDDTSFIPHLLPAMRSLRSALSSLGLNVTVTTPHSLSVLQNSYPPSAATFRSDITPILTFLDRTGAPFLINAYPFFAYKANPAHIPLDFALFQQPNPGLTDPATGLHYDNMLFSQVDSVYAALTSAGFRRIPVHVSETGWPSKGDSDEYGASLDNARKYNGNLIRKIDSGAGTPMKPNIGLKVHIFALFNENMKPGPTSERNYGIFKPDGTRVYDLGLGTTASGNSIFPTANSSSSATGSQNSNANSSNYTSNHGPPQMAETSSTSYLSIFSSTSSKQKWDPLICLSYIFYFLSTTYSTQ